MILTGREEFKLISDADLLEVIRYPNGGHTSFYAKDDKCYIVDTDVWTYHTQEDIYAYSLLTDKQNTYMKKYKWVYRFIVDDLRKDSKENIIADNTFTGENFETKARDRSQGTDSSPLEMIFEKRFCEVYGVNALKYLDKEYPISDGEGHTSFIDYVIHTKHGNIGVEENGVTYHHPQEIGKDLYRKMLNKQNLCMRWGIRLFRFSTEDCEFENRIDDDIRSFFGNDTSGFLPIELSANRPVKLYEHQELTLQRIHEQREQGIHTFLIHYPTATGKSLIVEEDLAGYLSEHRDVLALILAPTTRIIEDWHERVDGKENKEGNSRLLSPYKDRIIIKSFSDIARHYEEYSKSEFAYIVVDEAHHAVAPVIRRVIEYFTPDFLVGLTATDERLDHKKLSEVFGTYQTDLTLEEAMRKGIVAEANVYRIETNRDLSN